MAKFCSECGEQLKVRRAPLWPSRALCYRCSPAYRRSRLYLSGALALSLAAGFAAGWSTRQPEPFYFIGTPVDSSTYAAPSLEKSQQEPEAKTARIQEAVEPGGAICGAPTRSGTRCRRRVRDGRLCWQHREKK